MGCKIFNSSTGRVIKNFTRPRSIKHAEGEWTSETTLSALGDKYTKNVNKT